MLGKRGLEAVDDVVLALVERERQVRADPDWDAEAGAAGDRNARADRDDVRRHAAVERAPAGEEVGCPARGCQDRDRVAERTQLPRDSGDVLVHLVRLGPRERRDQADAQGHRSHCIADD